MDRFALFPTPVFVYELDQLADVNAQLASGFVTERQTSPGVQRSNVGGWHSIPNLSQRPDPALRALMQSTVGCIGALVAELARGESEAPPLLPRYRYAVHGWAMVMERDDYVVLHEHGEAHWSTVYYADAGDDEAAAPSGVLAFVDPRRGGRSVPGVDLFPTTFTVRPRTGTLVVFPGWLQHYVHPYRGHRPRVSISCNVVMEAVP
jgi:uncharacterized protein (TIGR02466 family)